jgi:hypothetical protein
MQKYKTLKDLNKRINTEVEYLNRCCGSVASLKRYFTMYRNYLKSKIDTSQHIGSKSLLDLLLSKFRLNMEQQQIFKNNHVIEISQSQKNLRKIYDVQKFIDTGVNLLSSVSVYDKILALCALTGRRPAEIATSAIFSPVDNNKGQAIFTGQLKVKDRFDIKPYIIPLFADYQTINNTLQSIRRQKPQFIGKPLLFNSTASRELGIRVKRHFNDIVEGDIKVKDLRAIYATIAYSNYSQSSAGYITVSMNSYFSKILGHGENDVVTCGSYIDFCLPIENKN